MAPARTKRKAPQASGDSKGKKQKGSALRRDEELSEDEEVYAISYMYFKVCSGLFLVVIFISFSDLQVEGT